MEMLKHLPNLLTMIRIGIIPLLVGLFFVPDPWGAWLACLAFVVAAVTDYFDGFFARRWSSVSSFGKLMDPIADKMLVAAALFCLAAFDRIVGVTIVAAIIIMLREVLISGLREFLAGSGASGLPVSGLAKWKTAVQMVAIAVLIVQPAIGDSAWLSTLGVAGLWLAALLTALTGWDYVRSGMRQIGSLAVGQGGERRAEP